MPILRHIYDTATGTYQDVEVSQEVYNCYRRTGWSIRRNNARFYAHEIQFSSLIGGLDNAFENFDEFQSDNHDPQKIICQKEKDICLLKAFQQLSPADQHLLYFLVVEGCSERWYGQKMGLHFMTVHNRKKRALQRIRRLIKYT